MFELMINKSVKTDVLVVGGGGAATRAALSAAQAGANVRMAVKGKWLESGSSATAFSELLAIAAAIGHADDRDKPEVHYRDTMEAGRGFVDPELVWTLASEVPDRIYDLIEYGLEFDKQENGKLVQGMSDFATYPRTCRVNGVTAKHILSALAQQVRQKNIPVDEMMMVFKLLIKDERIVGALGWDTKNKELVLYETPAVILACGGAQQLYLYGVGTPDMTGDGYAMAYQAGVPLVNMEFVQIGPATLTPSITLTSGPVWKTHPILSNANGEKFLEEALPPGVKLQEVYDCKVFPFTVSNPSFYLDTSMQRELEKNSTPNGGVWCEMAPHSGEIIEQRMPKTKLVLKSKGIDVETDRFEIGLVAQCMNGGAQLVNSDAETKLKGLFAAGETAGGVRGPDRPGGNSLAEGQAFGHRAGTAAARYAVEMWRDVCTEKIVGEELEIMSGRNWKNQGGSRIIKEGIALLKRTMYANCLVIRTEDRLNKALDTLHELEEAFVKGEFDVSKENFQQVLELENMLIAAKAIVLSAKERKESRSCHYREDYPEKNDSQWKKSIRIRCHEGQMITEEYFWASERGGKG